MRITVFFVVAATLFLLFFHIVPKHGVVIPKSYPSFADTFIDIDEYLNRYNRGSFFDKIAIRQSALFQALRAKGIIREESETKSGTEKN